MKTIHQSVVETPHKTDWYNTVLLFLIAISVVICAGCASPNRYRETLTDYGFSFDRHIGLISIIPHLQLQDMTIEDWAITNGYIIVGHSSFDDSQQAEFDAIDVAKELGASHIVLCRKYFFTSEHEELETGYNIATSTTHTSFSGYANSYNTADSTTTTYIPYHYTVRVSTPIFHQSAYYLVKNN